MIPDTESRLLLAHIRQFLPLSEAAWQLLLPHLALQELHKGSLFAAEGQVAKNIGFMLSGSLRQFYTRDGEEKTTYFYFENHLVAAYVSCLRGQPSELSIEALSDSRLLVFPYALLRQLYDQSHEWERFGRLVAEYLGMGLEERMAGLLMMSPEERYLQLLHSNKQKILERIPQHYIANYLGITPVSLSRIRARVQKR